MFYHVCMQYMMGRLVFQVVTSQAFYIAVTLVIMLNSLVLCLENQDQSDEFEGLQSKLNIVFIIFFTGEFIIKLVAFRLYYFRDPWNVFDAIIVLLSYMCMIRTHFYFYYRALNDND